MIQNRISQRTHQIFEILGLYCFAFTALAIDKTFTQRNFLPNKIEIVSKHFPMKILQQMRPKIRENLRTTSFQSKIYCLLNKV